MNVSLKTLGSRHELETRFSFFFFILQKRAPSEYIYFFYHKLECFLRRICCYSGGEEKSSQIATQKVYLFRLTPVIFAPRKGKEKRSPSFCRQKPFLVNFWPEAFLQPISSVSSLSWAAVILLILPRNYQNMSTSLTVVANFVTNETYSTTCKGGHYKRHLLY